MINKLPRVSLTINQSVTKKHFTNMNCFRRKRDEAIFIKAQKKVKSLSLSPHFSLPAEPIFFKVGSKTPIYQRHNRFAVFTGLAQYGYTNKVRNKKH